MLQQLRTHSQSWYFKTIFVLLALSFVMWGVADMVTGYNSMRPIATVAKSSISQEEFMHEYDQHVRLLQERTRGKIKLDDDKKKNIQKEVLDRLIQKLIIRQKVESYNLSVTDAYISRHIQSDQTFYDDQNRFNKEKFALLLNRAHMSEGSFVKMIRANLTDLQLFQTLTSGAYLPDAYAKMLFEAQEQQKVFMVAYIPLTAVQVTQQPAEEDLAQLYAQNQDQFKRPATKKITILMANADQIKTKIEIPQPVLQDIYEKRKSEFKIPEKRSLQVIHAHSPEALAGISDIFSTGRPFSAISRDINGKFEDLPEKTRLDLAQAAQGVFDLPVGQVSEPINLISSWAVYVTVRNDPEYQQSFDEVREILVKSARDEKMVGILDDLRVKIDDGVAGGTNLHDLAKELNLDIIEIDHLTEKGADLRGREALPLDLKEIIMEKITDLSEGLATEVLDLPNGNMIVMRVDKENPAFIPPFIEIKEEVYQAWNEIQQQKGAAELAQNLAKAPTSGDFLTAVRANGLTVKTLKPVSRSSLVQDVKLAQELPSSLWRQAFVLKDNTIAVGPGQSGFIAVMSVKTISADSLSLSDKYKKFKESLTDLFKQDMIEGYFETLKKELEQGGQITVNESLLAKMRQH